MLLEPVYGQVHGVEGDFAITALADFVHQLVSVHGLFAQHEQDHQFRCGLFQRDLDSLRTAADLWTCSLFCSIFFHVEYLVTFLDDAHHSAL